MEEKKAQKISFFTDLYQLDEGDEDEGFLDTSNTIIKRGEKHTGHHNLTHSCLFQHAIDFPISSTESSTNMQHLQTCPQVRGASSFDNIKQSIGQDYPKASTDATQTAGPARSALDDAMEEVLGVENEPLDTDRDTSMVESSDPEETEDETSERQVKRKQPKNNSKASWRQKFSCMQKNDGLKNSENPNHHTIKILQEMLDHYTQTRDQWRTIAYRRAITALRNQSRKVVTKEEALRIPNIGKRLAEKIEEIVRTNRLKRLENAKSEPNHDILQMFTSVYGVGLAQATLWIRQGHRTIEDLVDKADLTKNQLIGIEHYDDFLARIPRDEVEQHGAIVRKAIHGVDEGIQVTIGGSYRRGAADSGDVDFIISNPNWSIDTLRCVVLEDIIPQLQEDGYLKAGLVVMTKKDGSKWHGAAVLPGSSVWRRVDFLLVPWEEMGAALLYFTGNDLFNRSIRLLASYMGMRLNQRGLWKDVARGRNREHITQGTLVEAKSERRIFEILGVPYWAPEQRNR